MVVVEWFECFKEATRREEKLRGGELLARCSIVCFDGIQNRLMASFLLFLGKMWIHFFNMRLSNDIVYMF